MNTETDDVEPKVDFDAFIRVLELVPGGFEPATGEFACPVCNTGRVVWSRGGPRSLRLCCTTPKCVQGLS